MANKIKIVILVFFVSFLSACFSTEFQPPVGLLVTSVKAPLITKLPAKKMLVEKKEDYLTRFFWIPLVVPAISITSIVQTEKNIYLDYEYQSYFFGCIQKVNIISYKTE